MDREYGTDKAGWECDGNSCTIALVVEQGANGLVAAVSYPNGNPVFTNTYTPPATARISAVKESVNGTP